MLHSVVRRSHLHAVKRQKSSMPRLCASKSEYPHMTAVQFGTGASLAFTKPDLGQSLDDFDPTTAMRNFSRARSTQGCSW